MKKVVFALLTALLITGSLICTVAWSNDKEKACDALVEYMQKSASVIRQTQGDERAKQLAGLKKEYAEKLRGVPEEAISAAETWLAQVNRFFGKKDIDNIYEILKDRDAAFKACGKQPPGSGF